MSYYRSDGSGCFIILAIAAIIGIYKLIVYLFKEHTAITWIVIGSITLITIIIALISVYRNSRINKSIAKAIENKETLKIRYKKPGEKAELREISDIHYCDRNGNIKKNTSEYISAYCRLRNANRTFRIDRIRKIYKEKLNFFENIFRLLLLFIRQFWKYLFVVLLLIAIGLGIQYYYDRYYLPEKLLNNAVEDIVKKMESNDNNIKGITSYSILKKNYEWEYENVNKNDIAYKLTDYRKRAFIIIDSLANDGDSDCQFYMGCLYDEWPEDSGYYETKTDFEKSSYWYNETIKSDSTYSSAYNNLANHYLHGQGVKKNSTKAVKLYRIGALLGDEYAQLNLGDLYRDGVSAKIGSHWDPNFLGGLGTEVSDYKTVLNVNINQAIYWWKKSAAQGNKDAKERLQKIYE